MKVTASPNPRSKSEFFSTIAQQVGIEGQEVARGLGPPPRRLTGLRSRSTCMTPKYADTVPAQARLTEAAQTGQLFEAILVLQRRERLDDLGMEATLRHFRVTATEPA